MSDNGIAPAGKIAIVTGGHRGIGLAIVRALQELGHQVVVGSRTPMPEDSQSGKQKHFPVLRPVVWFPLDVCSSDSVKQFTDNVLGSCGSANILVNNAGVSVHQTVCGHSDVDWHNVIETNLTGPFKMIRACLPAMMEKKWGRIINIASTAASSAEPTHAAYCASKSGLLGLSRAVAREGAPAGVTCVTVSPTWVETDMLHKSAALMAARENKSTEEIIQNMAAANPQNRLVQAPEIGALVAFLSGDLAAGLTMEDIQVNAGAHW